MSNSVRFLCIIILTYCSAAECYREEYKRLGIPENCSKSEFAHLQYYECPHFNIHLYSPWDSYDGDNVYSVECKDSSFSYEYLRNANSDRQSLKLTDCQLPESGSIGEGWPRLEFLRVSNYADYFGQLKREHFSGLNDLWYLELSTNSTQTIPDDLFADLPKLRVIDMYVESASKKLFANLNELESLKLTIRSQESLNNFDLSELKFAPKFKVLKLRSNNFMHLTKRFFEGCSNIEYVDLSESTFKTIDFDAFETLTNLKNISMQHVTVASLPEGLFSKNKNLEKVKITTPKTFIDIPSGLLSNLANLREVIIYCGLTSISSDLLSGSNNVEKLDLRYNELTSLPHDFFQHHSKLRKVFLSYNKLPAYPDDYFDGKSELTEVIYSERIYTGFISHF